MRWIKDFIKRRHVYNAIRESNSFKPLLYKYTNEIFENFSGKTYEDNFSYFLRFAYKKDPEFFRENISSFICAQPITDKKDILKLHPLKKFNTDIKILNIHYLYIKKVNNLADSLLEKLVSEFNYIDIFTFLILCNESFYDEKMQSLKAMNSLSQYLKKSIKNKRYLDRPISTQLSYLILDEINQPKMDIDRIKIASIINSFDKYEEEQKNIIINETYFTLLYVFLEYIINEQRLYLNTSLHYSHKRNGYLFKLYKINVITEIFFLIFPEIDVFKKDTTFNASLFEVYNSIFSYLAPYSHLMISLGFGSGDINNNKISFLKKIDSDVLKKGYSDNQEEFDLFLSPEKESHLELISKIENIQIMANKNVTTNQSHKNRVSRL